MDIFPTLQSLVFVKDKRATGTCGMMDMGIARDALQSTVPDYPIKSTITEMRQ